MCQQTFFKWEILLIKLTLPFYSLFKLTDIGLGTFRHRKEATLDANSVWSSSYFYASLENVILLC